MTIQKFLTKCGHVVVDGLRGCVHWWFEQLRYDRLVYVLILALGVWWHATTHVQYEAFGFRGGDSSVAEQALWNTIFTGQLFQQTFLNIPGEPNLREHLNFVQFLYLPLYALVPHTLTLFAMIQAAFVAGALYLYRFASARIGSFGATLATALFALHPLTTREAVDHMHVVSVAGVFFLLALIAYEKRALRPFVFWTIVTAVTTEFVEPTVFLLGVLALHDRRSWQWVAAPMASSMLMYAAAKYYITIGFSTHARLMEVLAPHALFALDGADKRIDAVVDMLKPLLVVVPFVSRYGLLLLPSIVIALYITSTGRLTSGSHVFILVPPILAMAFIDLAQRWSERKFARRRFILYAVATIGMCLVLGSTRDILRADSSALAPELTRAVAAIKDGGSVTADPIVGVHVNRRAYFDIAASEKRTDYIILKGSKHTKKKSADKDASGPLSFRERIAADAEYRRVFLDGRVMVFAKVAKVHEVLGITSDELQNLPDEELQKQWAEISVRQHYPRYRL